MPRLDLTDRTGGQLPDHHRRAARPREARPTPAGCRGSRWPRLAAIPLLACLGACSTLGAIDDDALVTGSVKPKPVALAMPVGEAPSGILPADWAEAKLALDQALAATAADPSIPWENKASGTRGTATLTGTARAGGCRDFMISVVDGKAGDRWVQGEACRAKGSTRLLHVRLLGRA